MNEQDRYAQSVIPAGNVIVTECGKEAPSAVIVTGISKRELFAAMAMQGILTRTERSDANTAHWAVVQADALLAELAK